MEAPSGVNMLDLSRYVVVSYLLLINPSTLINIQIAPHFGPVSDPDRRDSSDVSGVIDTLRKFVKEFFPTVENTPSIVEKCMYTVSCTYSPHT